MTSIFIWKSDKITVSDKTITYYNGSNWFLEDFSTYSKSYIYLDQYNLIGVQCYLVKEMPSDWVGNYLLEKLDKIPYCLIKEDEYAILEQIGKWLRCKLKISIDFGEKNIEEQWNHIQKWISIPIKHNKYPSSSTISNKLNIKMDSHNHFIRNK